MVRITKASPEHLSLVQTFFKEISSESELKNSFNPHPFTDEEAQKICSDANINEFYILVDNVRVYSYGMLRYTEGYPDPSLGVAVARHFRGKGFGEEMVAHLISVARQNNAPYITLHVNKNNPARFLYKKLGFVLVQSPRREGELKGIFKF